MTWTKNVIRYQKEKNQKAKCALAQQLRETREKKGAKRRKGGGESK